MIRLFFAVIFIAVSVASWSQTWQPDTLLTAGYYSMTINHPDDYSGKIVSTVVRKGSGCASGKAVLYVHGFNDYFFQGEMGDEFVGSGYDFYAVDLRKYGRSILAGQKKFQVRNLNEYFPDIDSALSVIRKSGVSEVVLMGHSTGGLITSLYMSAKPDTIVKALILNSPFFDWNLSKFNEKIAVPVVGFLGKMFPGMKIRQGDGTAYSESLLASEHGEWNFNTSMKLRKSPDVDAGWINAINSAQHKLRSKKYPVKVPVLLLHSAESASGKDWNESYNRADGVLDVRDIAKYGADISENLTEITIDGGLHDLVLSAPEVRRQVYVDIFRWLESKGL